MEQIDNDVADFREESIQALRAGFLAQSLLEDQAKEIWHRTEIGSVHADACESATGDVELVTESDVNVGHIRFCCVVARPLRQGFEQLLGRDQEVSDALLDLR